MPENKNTEYKEKISKSFLKTVSAFANYSGGKIYFGIDDEGNKVGIDELGANKLRVEEMINGNIRPVPNYELDIDGNILILNVFEGMNKPYFYESKAYKRSDTSTVEIDTYELKNLIIEGQNIDFEETKSNKQDLTFEYLEKKLKQVIEIEKLTLDILKTLRLYNAKNQYNLAAYLLSDSLEGVGIDAVKFGESINELEKRVTVKEGSILKQFDEIEKMFEDYYVVERIEGTRRENFEKVPREAFREAIANAMVHRRWNINADIRVKMFSDCIEIISPGGLPSGITREEFINGQYSSLRNPILADVFFRLKLIEKFGTGILRIKELYKDSMAQPKFDVYENSITVILPTVESIVLDAIEQKIYDYLKEHGWTSRTEVQDAMGIERHKAIEILNSLVERNIIDVEGQARATKYNINLK